MYKVNPITMSNAPFVKVDKRSQFTIKELCNYLLNDGFKTYLSPFNNESSESDVTAFYGRVNNVVLPSGCDDLLLSDDKTVIVSRRDGIVMLFERLKGLRSGFGCMIMQSNSSLFIERSLTYYRDLMGESLAPMNAQLAI